MFVIYGEFSTHAANNFCRENNIGDCNQIPLNNLLVEGWEENIMQNRMKIVEAQIKKELRKKSGKLLFFRGEGKIQDHASKVMKEMGFQIEEILVDENSDIKFQTRKSNLSSSEQKSSWLSE